MRGALDPIGGRPESCVPLESPRTQPGPALAGTFFATLVVLQITVAIPAQLLGIGPGLIFTELFVFLWPSILLIHRLGAGAGAFVRAGPVPLRLVGLGLLLGMANYPIALVLEASMHRLLPELAKLYDTGATLSGVTGSAGIGLAVGIGLLAPLGEEFAFRGVIQRLFRTRWSSARAVGVTAILFSLIHLDPVGFPGRVELGVLFGVLALWSGSIWTGMAAHAGNNVLAMVLLYGVGGRSDDPLPGAGQLLLMLVAGAIVVVPLLLVFRRAAMGRESPIELPEIGPRPVGREVSLWMGAMTACLVAMIAVDPVRFQLGITDATTPYQQGFADSGSHRDLDAHLRLLHDQAARGEVSLESYGALRKWLFDQAQARQLDAAEAEKRVAELGAKAGP